MVSTAIPRQSPGALWRALALTGYAALCLVYVAWGWADELTDLGGDSAMYMLMARHLSPFHPASAVIAEAVQTSAYPPLFPLLIAGCGGSILAGHLVAVACLLAALPFLYLWLCGLGLTPAVGFCIAAVFALMPGTYLLALHVWTENPYLLFCLVALWAQHRAESGVTRPYAPWLAAAGVALATLTRAAALPLLAAFATYLLMRRPRRWPWLMTMASAPFVAWSLAGRSQQAGFSNYLGQFTGRYAEDAGGVLWHQVAGESRRLLEAWARGWTGYPDLSAPLNRVALLIGLVCLAGWLLRLVRLRLDALYVAFYFGLLLVWPFPAEAERLEYVLVPVLLAEGTLLLHSCGKVLGKTGGPRLLAAGVGALALLITPSLVLTIQRYFLPAPRGYELVRHTPEWYGDDRLRATPAALVMAINFSSLRNAGSLVPPGACIFSIKPSVVTLYTERASYLPPPIAADDAAFQQGILRCRYLYPMALVSPSFPEPFYPLGRLNGRGKALLEAAGGDESHWDTYGLLVDRGSSEPASAAPP